MKFETLNQQGKKGTAIELSDSIFNVEIEPALVQQVAVIYSKNQRQALAHTKDRSEVRGGGKKPWKQKGTGRARAGSIRSPLWRHGGITFGPRNERNFKRGLPEKMRKSALLMVLTGKVKDKEFIVFDDFKLKDAKTKNMAEILQKTNILGQSFIFAVQQRDEQLYRACRNIDKAQVVEIRNINAFDLLNRKYFVTTSEGVKVLEKMFGKK